MPIYIVDPQSLNNLTLTFDVIIIVINTFVRLQIQDPNLHPRILKRK